MKLKPIHHSKLKKGDLIYVESKQKGFHFSQDTFEVYIPHRKSVLHLWTEIESIGMGINIEFYINNNAEFFLIERGYFL